MQIKFLDYQENIFEKSIDNNRPRVYVFDNYGNLRKAREYYQRPFLEKQSFFISMDDLKEKLFPTGRLLLREEKRTLLLYELLTEEEKKELGIDYYFDFIELAAGLFRFYDELNEYLVEELDGLQGWQEEKYKIYQDLYERYCRRMEELGYTDSTLAFDFRYFNDFILQDYEGITFVNIIYFSPKEKLLLERLEESGYELELFLQLAEEDYDRENLRIKSFTLPENPVTEIDLYSAEDDLLQLVNLLFQLEQNKGLQDFSPVILDADFVNSNYERLLSPDRIQVEKEIPYTETGLYRFLENLYELFMTADRRGGELRLEIDVLLKAFYQKGFRNYYGLEVMDLKKLQQLAGNNYAYLSEGLLDSYGDDLLKFRRIFADLKGLYASRNLQDFIAFLEEIDLERLDEDRFTNNIGQYYDALMELASIEEMDIVSLWNKYFPEKAAGFFRLVLNYLRYKKLNLIETDDTDERIASISALLTAGHLNRDWLFILNASRGVIPGEGSEEFLLTEKQREENGLETGELKRLKEKYYFFRHVFSSRKAVIFTLNNLEENISSSPFVEELVLRYDLEIKETSLKAGDYHVIIGKFFAKGKEAFNKGLDNTIIEEDKLHIEENDFPREFSLAYYKYGILRDCYYKFFLACLHRLEEEIREVGKEISPAFLGNLVHDLFLEIIRKTGGQLPPAEDLIRETVEKKLQASALKINNYYRKYYEDILFPKIGKSIDSFFKTIAAKTGDKISEIRAEWVPEEARTDYIYENEITSIYLNGRIDLFIEAENKSYLIDFKTGSGNLKQLDFYALLLAAGEKEETELEKGIYNVFEEKFETGREGTELELLEEIKKTVEGFFQDGKYSFEYKASLCIYCTMKDICRVVRR